MMQNRKAQIGLLLVVSTALGCTSARLRVSKYIDVPKQNVRVIAMNPFGLDNDVAVSIGEALEICGFRVISLSRIDDLEVPADRQALENDGADAFVKITARRDGLRSGVESIKLMVYDVHSGAVMGIVEYTNGWGGAPGSVADHAMRDSNKVVARKIANRMHEWLAYDVGMLGESADQAPSAVYAH